MELSAVQRIVDAHRNEILARGVLSSRVFGSVVRQEQRPDSDVDMLVEFDRPTGLFGLIELRLLLEEWLGCRVDLGTASSLRSTMRDRVLSEAVRVA